MARERRPTQRPVALRPGSRRAPAARGGPSPRTVLFVASIAGSAFLLFTLELLAGRLVLPSFGGTPAVWTTALAFFTAVLFIGYLYAHLAVARLGPRRSRIVHLGVAAVALVATVLGPRDVGALRVEGMPEALNVLLALSVIAGAPAFLLATTTPVLSTWFAESGEDPWWLYAASNGASLVGLLAYPFLIEPTIGLSLQRTLFAVGLGLFVASLLGIVARGRRAAINQAPIQQVETTVEPGLGFWRPTRWLIAAFVPAGLLAATTAFLATDLVSAPLIWVGPLGIYLASLVVAFSERGRRVLPVVEWFIPAAATLLWIPWMVPFGWPIIGLLVLIFACYGVLAVTIHGRLALDRPSERHLTFFYLVLSAGGLLATAFVALVAPLIFNAIYEYPLLLVAGLGVLAVLPGPVTEPIGGRARVRRRLLGLGIAAGLRVVPLAVSGLVVVWLLTGQDSDTPKVVPAYLALGAGLVALSFRPAILAAGTAGLIVVLAAVSAPANVSIQVRTFFGVIEVDYDLEALASIEYSGTTLHGVEFLDDRRFEPTSYYVRAGPLGDVFDDLRARTHNPSIAVVGLGTGTTATYSQPGDEFTFYEIDPAVVRIAQNPAYFTYLSQATAPIKVVLGDARLSLAAVADSSIDLMVLDAFASDAVPAHLLTREAMAEYRRVLRPGGIAIFHLSNRYYELSGAVAATARSLGLATSGLSYEPGPENVARLDAKGSEWVIIGAAVDVARFDSRGWKLPPLGPVLTDDFFDTLRLLRSDAL